ncbi:ABC-2 family transporter protein [Jatrophihabitans endophyticus]|uniref:ABC-2 family transporter protein n=1 Tax=Jatrophihabitans endophyticus TaxID=1206085 RepID=A0A1M5DWN3_9ACTN|nr:ABC transporter permease [Jatrophihabitans endophyticus]SHF71264.1 ABC-2 family transporter protein [Jatrophihabitans endophyticus]
MTAVAPEALPDRAADRLDVSFVRVCRSEWTKLRSVRSTWWLLLLAIASIVGIGMFGQLQSARHADGDPYYRHPHPVDLARNTEFGLSVAVLAVLMVGALVVTGEYGTGLIRSTMTVVPRRTTVLLAKAAVLLVVVGLATAGAAVLTLLGAGVVWSAYGRAGASFADPGVVGVVAGVPLYCAAAAVFALAVGALVRHSAAALGVLAASFFVAPAMLASWDGASYLPANAGGAMAGVGFGDSLSGGAAMTLFAGYAAVLLGLALARLRHADV